ncbi:hypothetical protein EYF80_008863 [Liparis tanakae]|uniref:Ig-like domain-containing protein n=1 Tax=Liparis tanakae TaxID=230148 RepID=A0A4Z2ITE3_9TELE|nr:hypothetical protein EYF80_008863 [Liparis tanakae]
MLHAARCTLHAARCTLHAARCTLHAARCTLHAARCMLEARWLALRRCDALSSQRHRRVHDTRQPTGELQVAGRGSGRLRPLAVSVSVRERVAQPPCAMCGAAWSPCVLLWVLVMGVYRARGQVTAPASLRAEVGRPLLLGCNVTTETGETVRQVRWLNGRGEVLLAYQPSSPLRVSHQNPGVQLTASHRDASSITIKRVRPDDEGCYRCVFDVYPRGPLEGSTCISITGQSEVRPAEERQGDRRLR